MHNFKVGDVVERVDAGNYSGMPSGKQGIITEVSRNGSNVRINGYGSWWHLAKSLRAVEQDDPLPPAPESVMYFNSIRDEGNDQCITVRPDNDPYYTGTLCISVHPRGDYAGYQSVALDPDAALQLAHDLRRMAMEIKRKERNG